jgi:hypothetical protein
MCQDAHKPPLPKGVLSFLEQSESRQDAQLSDRPRPCGATESATDTLAIDPDFQEVIDAWPALPETVKAGIMAMVRAARG